MNIACAGSSRRCYSRQLEQLSCISKAGLFLTLESLADRGYARAKGGESLSTTDGPAWPQRN